MPELPPEAGPPRPPAARVYDFLTGGKSKFAADRETSAPGAGRGDRLGRGRPQAVTRAIVGTAQVPRAPIVDFNNINGF